MFIKLHSDYWVNLVNKYFHSSNENCQKYFEKMINGTITDKIYHGCATRYSNGERKLIDFEKGERCIYATSNPFWKEPNTCYRMKRRKSTKNRQLIKGPYKYVYKNLQ